MYVDNSGTTVDTGTAGTPLTLKSECTCVRVSIEALPWIQSRAQQNHSIN